MAPNLSWDWPRFKRLGWDWPRFKPPAPTHLSAYTADATLPEIKQFSLLTRCALSFLLSQRTQTHTDTHTKTYKHHQKSEKEVHI